MAVDIDRMHSRENGQLNLICPSQGRLDGSLADFCKRANRLLECFGGRADNGVVIKTGLKGTPTLCLCVFVCVCVFWCLSCSCLLYSYWMAKRR